MKRTCWACRKEIPWGEALFTEIRVRVRGGEWRREVPFHENCLALLILRTAPEAEAEADAAARRKGPAK